MSDPVAVGIDIGGTKLVAAAVTAEGEVVARDRRRTPIGDVVGLFDLLTDLAGTLGPGLPVGVGVAGIVGAAGELVYAPNLRLRSVPIAASLGEALGVPVAVGNDANVALYGEARVGSARGAAHAVMFTLGTGVGGGVLVDGRPVLGRTGYAGELGHLIVEEGGRLCPCGNRGCIEAYASGTAIGVLAQERLDAGASSELSTVASTGLVTGKDVGAAATRGDEFARSVLRDVGGWLGVAVASIVNALDPEIVVVGGGASTENAGFVLPAAASAARERLLGAPHREPPPIVLAELGDDAGMIGAALLAAAVDG